MAAKTIFSSLHCLLTSTPVSEQVTVHILNVGVDGGATGNTSWGHIGVSLRVNIL